MGRDLSRGVLQLELTKSGRRREVPMNDASYRALVSLGPKANGRVFKTRYIRTAYNYAVAAAKLDDVTFTPCDTLSCPGQSCAG